MMKLLLDTHILLWALKNDPKLPGKAKELILDEDNELYYSTASVWEIAIKHAAHPERMHTSGTHFSEGCNKMGYKMLPISDSHVQALENLERSENAPEHNDPFDRILIAQAKAENMMFVTHDSRIPYYDEAFIVAV